MPMPSQGKSVLMTADPYHTPGYGGFCPQFKYQIGETFGRTTSRLLGDKNVSSSGRLVLNDLYPSLNKDDQLRAERQSLIRCRTQSWGDQKLAVSMVPGYTGFIPKSQHYFGKRYAENALNSIADFEGDQQNRSYKTEEMRRLEAQQSGRLEAKEGELLMRHKTPLVAIAKMPKTFISSKAHQHSLSPYYMPNVNKDKCFMSGYTGFVPRSRGLLGKGYPIITHEAINDFTDDLMRIKMAAGKPISIRREEIMRIDTKPIYPKESGLVPHYTGHIPGQRFRFGQTFGHSTQNAMEKREMAIAMPIIC